MPGPIYNEQIVQAQKKVLLSPSNPSSQSLKQNINSKGNFKIKQQLLDYQKKIKDLQFQLKKKKLVLSKQGKASGAIGVGAVGEEEAQEDEDETMEQAVTTEDQFGSKEFNKND